jgi:predicted GNAT superfamily acetyltransferase
MFIVARETGGQVLFAYDQEKPIGFALAFPAIDEKTTYLHSHMVGVAPDYQNRGVGRLLKLAQRDDAMARGIRLIEWTFDPLQLRNDHFNLVRLGAVVRRYIPNFYEHRLAEGRLAVGFEFDAKQSSYILEPYED